MGLPASCPLLPPAAAGVDPAGHGPGRRLPGAGGEREQQLRGHHPAHPLRLRGRAQRPRGPAPLRCVQAARLHARLHARTRAVMHGPYGTHMHHVCMQPHARAGPGCVRAARGHAVRTVAASIQWEAHTLDPPACRMCLQASRSLARARTASCSRWSACRWRWWRSCTSSTTGEVGHRMAGAIAAANLA